MHDFAMVWDVIIWVVVTCTSLATIRLLLAGLNQPSNYSIVNFISSKKWCMSLFIILPSVVAEFGNNRLSPLPWIAFTEAAARHGHADGGIAFLEVCIADLWLLLVPAQMYASDLPDTEKYTDIYGYNVSKLEKEKVRLIRIINLLVGLLLMTPDNPLIKLIKL